VEVQVLSSALSPATGRLLARSLTTSGDLFFHPERCGRARAKPAPAAAYWQGLAVIVLWPLALAGAVVILVKSRQRGLGNRGWVWFSAWAIAGALAALSVVTDIGVALYFFPAAVFATFWLALHAPYGRELSGYPAGIAAVLTASLLV
jgi:hypothetical protein